MWKVAHKVECLIAVLVLLALGKATTTIPGALVSDRPPCEISTETGHCGCTATSCDMPCMGCCPDGCKLPPNPTLTTR